ncbi:mechanosensitive ion channel [Modestobacter sp. I12A-02628]|uniref:Mechanosensitive ion channel family protein n=1 Tax=Goekera deserti TaxID=2497753 RepID=A0A7K3WBR9_9ACTN|nr:mechanosensitive ion channel family protein [Goekera deserti]MPQ97370.1 mechanosensitive ion channel [Goekera deserti]NDI48029.1 mechanosensitive ion channel [Goekera deserti]NEL53777.1 mechanosensitive ion channel family protein [Goekera deserti]
MNGSLSVIAAATDTLSTVPSCVATDATSLCARVYQLFGSAWLAANAETLIAVPARIVLIVVVTVVVRLLVHRAIHRLTDQTASGQVPTILRARRGRSPEAQQEVAEQASARRTQRAEAIGSLLRSTASFLLLGIAVVLVLGELGIDLAPIVASAGVIGVALGFGAQNLVKDFIAGIAMILEDQYGIGDVVDLGEAVGTVEGVGLRITRLRDVNGVVWYARNGEILRVGNKSQGYAQVVIDMPVAHDTDLDRCRTVMQEVADGLAADDAWGALLLAAPESLGVETITPQGISMRLVVRTTNADQWRIARELRMRLTERFAVEGIRTPPALMGAAPAAGSAP